jgi:hypothetical protein
VTSDIGSYKKIAVAAIVGVAITTSEMTEAHMTKYWDIYRLIDEHTI